MIQQFIIVDLCCWSYWQTWKSYMSEFILKHGSGFTVWRQNCSVRYCGHLVRCLSWRKTGRHCLMDLPGLGGFWLFCHWARSWRWECYRATLDIQIIWNQFSFSFFTLPCHQLSFSNLFCVVCLSFSYFFFLCFFCSFFCVIPCPSLSDYPAGNWFVKLTCRRQL